MELLKFSPLVSTFLFLLVALFLAKQAPGYTFSGYTISKSIQFLQTKRARKIFQGNFYLKALLDVGFWWYLIDRNILIILSIPSLVLFLTFFLFGTLGYITEEKNHLLHRYIVYVVIAGSCLTEILLAATTGSQRFYLFSIILATVSFVYAFWYMLRERVNVFVQLICGTSLFIWTSMYIFFYL